MKIGIDVGGSHIAVGAVNDDNILLSEIAKDIKIAESEDPAKILLENMIMLIEDLIKKEKINKIDLIGIACPGIICDGIIIRAENLKVYNTDIVSIIKEKFNVNVILRNDAKCAALAEKANGSLTDVNDAVFLTLGTGIGGAVFLDGKLLKPANSDAFELGHTVIDTNGKECTCGRKGCFETYGSMRRFKNKIRERLNLGKDVRGKQIEEMLRNEEDFEKVKDIVDEYVKYMCIGLENLINIFEPQVISIGGSFAHYEDILCIKIREELKNRSQILNKKMIPEIRVAKLGNTAGIIGATIE